ncbi:MAG TPA: DUF3617 family protein [Candidatus Acidoferrum sp.]|nr:DUF3617 family protein [Candidatus Acidoferrum sp.]
MRGLRAACAIVLAGLAAGDARAGRGTLLPGGSYEVRFRLELPHLESWAIEKTRTICVADAVRTDAAPLPVLSGNNPLATCPASNVHRGGATLQFDIRCPGRNEARAHAAYALLPDGFKGRIAMVMGAKNMTMTEVQVGRRIGRCDLAGVGWTAGISD